MRTNVTSWIRARKRIGAIAASGALVATTIGICGWISHAASAATGPGVKIGVSFDKMDEPFRIGEKKSLENYAKQLGVTLTFDDAQQSAVTQSSQIRSLIAQRVAGIIEIPWDTHAVAADISAAKAAGIPLALMDQEPASTQGIFYYAGGDPCADGRTAGQFLVNAAGGRHLNTLELLGSLNNVNGIERSKCFESVVAKASNIRIVAKVPTDWRTDKAFRGTQNALQQHPDINAVYTPWNGGLPAIYSVLKAVHKLYPVGDPKHVITISIDGAQLGCKYVGDHMDDLDIATPLPEMARVVITAVVDELKDHTQPRTNVVLLPGLPYTPADFAAKKSQVWGCAS